MLVYLLFTLYMGFAIRQYGRWLRDNYADLENKEVWLSHLLIIVVFLLIIFYRFVDDNITISFIVQAIEIPFFGFLLWRVETLQQLDGTPVEATEEAPAEQEDDDASPSDAPSGIGQLLELHCEGTQLYLQHDLSLSQLSHAVGTNHYYLSQYFTQQGLTYNAYINGLRIRHFVNLYNEAVANQRSFTAQQLASESGFGSYSTFSTAFKQRMGQTVTAWMRGQGQ
jgi:AraC-like DNA-binding protein